MNLDNFEGRYEGNLTLRTAIKLVPVAGSVLDFWWSEASKAIRVERLTTFYDRIAAGDIDLDEATVRSEDFLHKFFAAVNAAARTRRREKIELLACLFASSAKNETDADHYEELLVMLDSISHREWRALVILSDFYDRPRQKSENDLQWTSAFWREFCRRAQDDLGIYGDEFTSFMNKIERTGLYQQFVGAYLDYSGGVGKLTPHFFQIRDLIQSFPDKRTL